MVSPGDQASIERLAAEISDYQESIFNIPIYQQHLAFQRKFEKNVVNESDLETLALSYDLMGNVSQARRCYGLLVILAVRDNPSEPKIDFWHARLMANTIREYRTALSQCDKYSKEKNTSAAVQALWTAAQLRNSRFEMQDQHPFSEISNRLYALTGTSEQQRGWILQADCQIVRNRSNAHRVRNWLQPTPGVAIEQFNSNLETADEYIGNHNYMAAVPFICDSLEIALTNQSVRDSCNWKGRITDKLDIIDKAVPNTGYICARLKLSYQFR